MRTCLLIFWTLWDQSFLLWKESVRSDFHHSINFRRLWLLYGVAKASGRSTDKFRKKRTTCTWKCCCVFEPWVPGLLFFLPAPHACSQERDVSGRSTLLCRDDGVILAYSVQTYANRRSDIKDPQFTMQRGKNRSTRLEIPVKVPYGNKPVLNREGNYQLGQRYSPFSTKSKINFSTVQCGSDLMIRSFISIWLSFLFSICFQWNIEEKVHFYS